VEGGDDRGAPIMRLICCMKFRICAFVSFPLRRDSWSSSRSVFADASTWSSLVVIGASATWSWFVISVCMVAAMRAWMSWCWYDGGVRADSIVGRCVGMATVALIGGGGSIGIGDV
jgi:hypothetical protein